MDRENTALIRLIASLLLLVVMAGCSSSSNQDIVEFMDQTRAESDNRIRIEPLPAYPPYVAVVYKSAGFRSPFDPPREVVMTKISGNKAEPPDLSRPKEYLERFNIAELKMVGTIERDDVRWALIKDSSSSVHRVKTGSYVGRNYGLITRVGDSGLDLTEIVVNGQGGWIERPRSMNMAITRE